MKLPIFILLITILLATMVLSHANIIYNVNLDFEKGLQSSIDKAAEKFAERNDSPVSYDFDRERIIAKFNEDQEYSITLHPTDFWQMGFRDGSQPVQGNPTVNTLPIAQNIFKNIPQEYKAELVYGGMKTLYTGAHRHIWYRYVNDVIVLNEIFDVEVNPVNGDVISWQLSLFSHDKDYYDTTPAISSEVAQIIAQMRLKATAIENIKPILMIEKEKLLWIVKVKSLYPVFVAVNAHSGWVVYSGSVRGEFPPTYDYGRDVAIIPNELIKKVNQ